LFCKVQLLDKKKKRNYFQIFFSEFIAPLTLKFLNLLLRKSRIVIFHDIVKAYEEFYNEANDILNVTITTAQPFNDSLLQKLESKINNFFPSKSLQFNENIDKEILGGFVVNFYDYMIDKSLRTRLIQDSQTNNEKRI